MQDEDFHFLNAVNLIQERFSPLSYVFIGTNTNPSPIINTSWLENIGPEDLVYGIEPFPSAYAKCLTFFREFPNIKAKVVNSAISKQNGVAKLYQGVSDWKSGRKTGIHGSLLSPGESTGEYNNEMYVEVSTITFEYFAQLLGIPRIDVLVVDVEGYEYEILNQCLSLGFCPKLIYYEEFNMNSENKSKCDNLLFSKYNITKLKYDNLCILK